MEMGFQSLGTIKLLMAKSIAIIWQLSTLIDLTVVAILQNGVLMYILVMAESIVGSTHLISKSGGHRPP